MTPNTPIRLPKDPEARKRLAHFAGLTPEEAHAIDLYCYQQERERAQGILTSDEERHTPR